jgi:hypothetical protein
MGLGPPFSLSFSPFSETLVLPCRKLVAEIGKRSVSDDNEGPGQAEVLCSGFWGDDSLKSGGADREDESAVGDKMRVLKSLELWSSGQGSCKMVELGHGI